MVIQPELRPKCFIHCTAYQSYTDRHAVRSNTLKAELLSRQRLYYDIT